MTAGDEEADGLVDNLFRDVDDQFADLEREYSAARDDLAAHEASRADGAFDPVEASNERYRLMSEVAALEAEVSRQRDELDERDRVLGELGERNAELERQIAAGQTVAAELQAARQEILDERREGARLAALLDARAAERQELVHVAERLQNERDHVQGLLTTALARFDAAEAERSEMEDTLRHLQAARDTAADEHDARAHELIESRAELSRLADQLDDFAKAVEVADERAEKAEALAERRTNEAGYLNRRIDAMSEKIETIDELTESNAELQRRASLDARRISELERDLASQQAEAAASARAVETIAERISDYDAMTERIAVLEGERDAAWEAAAGRAPLPAAPVTTEPAEVPEADEADEPPLAERARELSSRRTTELEPELLQLEAEDEAVIDQDLAAVVPEPEPLPEPPPVPRVDPPAPPVPSVEPIPPIAPVASVDPLGDAIAQAAALAESAASQPVVEPAQPVPESTPVIEPVAVVLDDLPPPPPPPPPLPPAPPEPEPQPPAFVPGVLLARKRMILPAELVPNTTEAVEFLLSQPGVVAIVDARSTCGQAGLRPSELFGRLEALRDHFQVPVEVVVTPVSTPVGGAPDLTAIGVHHVTGAETVSDRVRSLCMGFPSDQPLVVIAGDDHVRRAAIGQEANVVEPVAVLTIGAD